MPRYYLVSFYYPGPYGNGAREWDIGDAVDKLLKSKGFDIRHAYSWPDGSLYKYVRSDHEAAKLWALLNESLVLLEAPATNVRVTHLHDVVEVPHNTDPRKVGPKTIEEWFAL